MPNGYTAKILEGCTFEEYVLACARGVSANIMLRDEGLDCPIPVYEPDISYYQGEIEKKTEEISKIKKMDRTEVEKMIVRDYQIEIDYHDKWRAESEGDLLKYQKVMAQVIAWDPPSPDHEEFKERIVKHISESIEFDCRWHIATPEPVPEDPVGWIDRHVAKLEDDISYWKKNMQEEIERTERRNEWNRLLMESLRKERVK